MNADNIITLTLGVLVAIPFAMTSILVFMLLKSRGKSSGTKRGVDGRYKILFLSVTGGLSIFVLMVGDRLWKYYDKYDDYEHYHGYTMAAMSTLAQAINQYELRNNRLPVNLDELAKTSPGNALVEKGQLEDPFGKPYAYRPATGGHFELRSAGSDEKFDTWDDYILKK